MIVMATGPGNITVIRITDEGQVYMRSDKGALVSVALTAEEVARLRAANAPQDTLIALAAIIARLARPN